MANIDDIISNAFSKKKKKEEETNVNISNSSSVDKIVDTAFFKKNINFDTFQSDLATTAKTIDSIYSGWQTPETMKNTLSSVQSMYDRIGKYQEYQKKYGGADLSELQSSYKNVLDGWEDMSKHYGKYESADAYTKALKAAEKSAIEYEGMKTADLSVAQKDIDDLEAKIKKAKDLEFTWAHYSSARTSKNAQEISAEAKGQLQQTLKELGYATVKDAENALGEKKVYLNKAERLQNGLKLSSVADVNSENYDKDFNKYVEKGKSLGSEKNDGWFSTGYKNTIAYLRENPDAIEHIKKTSKENGAFVESGFSNVLDYVAAQYMTDEEFNIYNYYLGKEDKEGADNYLKSIEETLKQRQGTDIYNEKESILSKYSFAHTAGIDNFVQGVTNIFNTTDDYIPTTGIQNASSLIREDIKYEHGSLGQVGYDLVNTTSNMLPSILTSTALSYVNPGLGSAVGSALMGTSAAGNAYQEMLNLGYDKGQARTYSTLVGASEAVLQNVIGGIGKLGGMSGKISKAVSGIDNALAKFAIQYGGSMASEGFEEAVQEVLNPLFMNMAAGFDTGAEVDWGEVVYSGLLGALSGGLLEGGPLAINSISEHRFNTNMGKNIKANERVGDIFDIASDPKVAEAYEVYTRYANKGINAENISDAKLGKLYSTTKSEAINTLQSKTATDEQIETALKNSFRLAEIDNAVEKGIQKKAEQKELEKTATKNFNVDKKTDESVITETGKTIGYKDISIGEDKVTVATENGNISIDDATLSLRDAELVEMASRIAKEEGENLANTFLHNYDKETSLEEYQNSFNLAIAYAKNDFSYKHIFDNKGSLSTEMVSEIYQEVTVKAAKEQSQKIAELNQKMADMKFYKGVIDDSAIDYDNTSAEGKVNWNDLDERQRQGITFIKGFAQATGMNLIIAHNIREAGNYNPNNNTITIDVTRWQEVNGLIKDTIIPTMSHETTHWMKNKSPELWNKLNEVVFSTLVEHYNKNITDESQKITELDLIKREYEKLVARDLKNGKEINKEALEDEAREEIIARACEDILSMSKQGRKIFDSLSVKEQNTLSGKIKELIQNLLDWVDELLHSYKSNSQEAKILREYKDSLNKAIEIWDEMLEQSVVANQALEKSGAYKHSNTAQGEVLHSEKITSGMSDSERADILRNKTIKDVPVAKEIPTDIIEKLESISSWKDINNFGGKDKRHLIRKIAQEFGAFKEYNNLDINISFEFSGNNFGESYGKQKRNYENFAKMFSVFDEVIEKAVGIEVHNRNNDGYKFDATLNNVYVLISAFEDGEWIIPIKLEVKEFRDKQNTLYVAISLEAIKKTEVSKQGTTENSVAQNSRSVTIIIPDIFSKINPKDISFLKYIPNEFLSKEQLEAKNKAINDRNFPTKDSTGRELSEGQMEYFKDSTVRDENGNLLVMYRGDADNFTVFDRKKTKHSNLYGRGFYFTNSKAHAEQYGNAREFYLDIKHPLSPNQKAITKKQMLNFLKAIENDGEDYDLYNYGQNATAESVLKSVWGKGDFEMLQDVNAGAIGDLVAAVELFNEVNGTNYDGIVLPTETVTFNSEQAKLTSNLNPTKDKDIRFSMKENVEETKDLVAVHNLSVEKLLKTLKLGGLPMPSIAITRAREGYNNFGEISLVFNKNTIDPEFMRSNKVYSGDAWTPTYPQIAYKVNEKVTEKIREKINAIVPKNVQNDLGGLHLDSSNLEDELNRHGDMANSYRYNYAMKYAFLKDNNVTIELPTKEEPFYRYGEISNSAVISFANKLVEGLKTANSLYEQHSSKLMADEDLLNSIATALNEDTMSSVDKDSEAYQELAKNPLFKPEDIDLSTVLGMLEASRKYFHSNGKAESKIDYRNARTKIDDYFNSHSLEKDYEYWLKKLFSNIVAKEGIRNNKDLFTPSGNRRSFEALHYEHTLENVIKAMKEEGTIGIGGFGGGNIFGASTREYGSIEDIKADAENRMHYLPESEYEEIKKGFRDRLFELANSLPIHKDSFSALDDATNMLIEAVSKFKTKSGMANYLRTESKGWATYSDYIVDDLIELVNDIRNMPAQYFEAKPQRAVGFNEIKAVIMPSQESYEEDVTEVKTELEKLNIPVLEYEYGDNNDRLKALNSLEDVRFSEKGTATESDVFTDIEGNERNILKHGDLGYKVLGTRKYNSYFPSAQEAIDAENDNIKSYYAKKLSVKRTYIDNMLKKDNQFLAKLSLDETRYSEKEDTVYSIMGETDRILKENEKFKAEIERLKERLALEKKVTGGKHFNENQLSAVAGHLRKLANNSTMDKVELMKAIRDLYSYIAHSPEVAWDEVWDKSYSIAKSLMDEAKPITIYDSYSAELLREIRNTRISLDATQKKEASYIFDKNWNRYFFGKVIITDKGTPIEVKWQEWHGLYPDIFRDDLSDGDKIRELYDIIESLKASAETVDKYSTEELTRELAYEVYNQYWNVSPIRTTADKYDKQIKRLNFEHRQMMNEIRTDYQSRLTEQGLADDIYYGRKLGEQKSKYESKIAEKNARIEKQKELYKKLRERKDEEIAIAKQHGKDLMNKYKDNAQKKTYIQRITANALTLNKWLTKNSKDYHIHEAMKGPVIKLLNAIDFSSKTKLEGGMPTEKDISFAEAFSEVKAMLQDADNMVEGLEALYGHDLTEKIELISKASFRLIGDNNYVINTMSSAELESLDYLVTEIKRVVTDMNKFHTVQHSKGAVNLANEFVEDGDKIGNIKKQHGKMAKFFEFRNRTPYYFFKDLGKVGEKLFKAFQDGWDKLAFNSKQVIDFANETYTDKEVKEWSKETKTFTLKQKDGKSRDVEMSIAQIMALHCVSKQDDAKTHLLSGGMTLKRLDSKGHVITDYENITLTVSDIQTILDSLTDRQREVADKLQEFMNTVCSEWGNEISMARFGIKMFGIPDYFPIKVSEATVPTDNTKDIDNASLFRLLNMAFTKARNKNAKQSIEIGDIFDIFAQHSSDMAKYNALALPVLDFNKFYSIHGMDSDGNEYGVAKTLKSVFGDEANGYIRRFVRDLNGSQNVSRDVIGNTFFKNAKLASVAANLRVILLQPTAFYKASAVMDNKYLLKASAYIKVEPIGMVKKLKKAIDRAEKYCGIVQWKSLGYYDTDISKGITEKIKHADTWKDKAIEKSLKLAEIADKATFGTLWVACEFEIRDTRKDLKVGSEEFYNAIAERLRDVIYATQVVDSTMTRSDMMRSADKMDKMLTTFGSEPTIAYNMLLDLVTTYNRDKKLLGSKEAKKKNAKKIRKVVTAYVITNAVAALVESGFDALRDDDDEEMDAMEFMKLYFKNFASDMSIGNKLPFIKELYSILQGYSSSRMDMQWASSLYYVGKDIVKLSEGEGNISKLTKDTLKAMSYMTGLPAYNVWRDSMAVLDKLGIIEEED